MIAMKPVRLTPVNHHSFRTSLWMIPVAIAIHNVEETMTMGRYADRYDWNIWAGPDGKKRWRLAVTLATALPLGITAAAVGSPIGSCRMRLALALPGVFAFNAITHVLQTVRHRDNMPGTATGVLVNIPMAAFIYRRALREGILNMPR